MKKCKIPSIVLITAFCCLFSFAQAKDIEKDAISIKKNKIDNSTTKLSTPAKNDNNEISKNDFPGNKSLTGETITWQVISSGGTNGSSANYQLSGTIGQLAVGSGTSTNYSLFSGFWQDFDLSTGCCVDIRGNFNGDIAEVIDIGDLVFMVEYQFVPGSPEIPCFEEGDIDANLGIDIGDLVYMVEYQFIPGSPLPKDCP